jgi:hypothetical protein
MIAPAVIRGEVMSAVGSHTVGSFEFPPGIDVRWETVRRVKWNEQRHASEECELVYEVSWIAEIGVWRRFLRSQQTVNG